jgi:thiamine transporter
MSKNTAEQVQEVKILAEMSVFVATAAALHYLSRLFLPFLHLPEGGSITIASMVPILWFALRRGLGWGLEAGIVYGLVDLALPGSYFKADPIEILLDYPLAFGALGLAGAFKKHPMIGTSLGIAGRFICHFISGVVFFYMYAWPGWHPALYSLVYNASYLVPEFIISAIVIFILLKRNLLNIYI